MFTSHLNRFEEMQSARCFFLRNRVVTLYYCLSNRCQFRAVFCQVISKLNQREWVSTVNILLILKQKTNGICADGLVFFSLTHEPIICLLIIWSVRWVFCCFPVFSGIEFLCWWGCMILCCRLPLCSNRHCFRGLIVTEVMYFP